MIAAPLCGVYVLSISLNRLAQCPASAFAIDTAALSLPFIWGTAVFFLSAFVFLACLGGVFIETAPPQPPAATLPLVAPSFGGSFRALGFAGALFGLSVSAMLWVIVRGSYTCIMTDGILLHPNPFVPTQTLTWDDVGAVRPACWMGKTGPSGGLQLSLSNNTTVKLSVWNARQKIPEPVYQLIRTALAGRHIAFTGLPELDQNICPPDLLRLFAAWHE